MHFHVSEWHWHPFTHNWVTNRISKYMSAVNKSVLFWSEISHGIYNIYFLCTKLWCAWPVIGSAQNIKEFMSYFAQQEVIIKTNKNEENTLAWAHSESTRYVRQQMRQCRSFMRKYHIYKIAGCFGFHLGGIWQCNSDQSVLCQYIAKTHLLSKVVITSNYHLLKPLKGELQPQFEDLSI